jgi:hypothetical protein
MNTIHFYVSKGIVILVLALLLMQSACIAAMSHTEIYHTYLLLKIESDHSRVQVGEAIHIRFTTRNTGNEPIVVEYQDTPVMDIVILGIGDQVLASWSSRNPEQLSHRLEWKPGESKTIELIWIPTQADYDAGEYYRPLGVSRIYASGDLYENFKLVKSAGFGLCFKTRC